MNIRELELPKHDDDDMKGEIVEAAEIDNKEEDKDTIEQQYDIDIENQADEVGSQASLNNSTVQQHFVSTNAF